jgi:hypothetical protein
MGKAKVPRSHVIQHRLAEKAGLSRLKPLKAAKISANPDQ